MIKEKTILAIIPARSGSKGVPRKNIRDLAGKPLIHWTINEAQKSKYIDRLILSSEDKEIINIAKNAGCDVPFKRPEYLAQDDTPGIDPVLYTIDALSESYDYILLLQPTSPLRTVEDIDNCIEFFYTNKALSCVSVTETDKSPYWMYKMDSDGRLDQLLKEQPIFNKRQDLPIIYVINGAIYIAETYCLKKNKTFLFKETIGYIMPKNRSVDIDEYLDFELCEFLLMKKKLLVGSVVLYV